MDIFECAKLLDKMIWIFDEPWIATKEFWFSIVVDAIKIVIAESNKSWRNATEALEPRKEAF